MKYIKRIKMHLMALALITISACSFAQDKQPPYILEHEADIAKTEPGTHNGGGSTTAYSFFGKANNLKTTFRKRILHPGAAIGYHLQTEDEIYYIINGTGEMQMNGKSFPVKAGDAILTRPGSSHGLMQTGTDDLAIFIVYQNK